METCKKLLSLLERCADSEECKKDIQEMQESLDQTVSQKVKEQ